jgi:hypothetical protein
MHAWCFGTGPGGREEEAWRPLLAPAFLQGLWLALERVWQQHGIAGAAGSGQPPAPALGSYLRAGSFPDGAPAWQQVSCVGHTWLGVCCSACEICKAACMACLEGGKWVAALSQELLGAFLSLSEVPEPARAAAACTEAAALAAAEAAPPAGATRRRRAGQAAAAVPAAQTAPAELLPHLSVLLSECPPETLQQMAACIGSA